MAKQLALDLSFRPAMGRDDFLVSPANAAAVAMVDQWPNWPAHAAIIAGPPGSGKSHLATVWQTRAHANSCAMSALTVDRVPDVLRNGAAVIEDADAGPIPETALFHLLNLAREQKGSVLLTATTAPGQWSVALPDLASRLRACPVVTIDQPDDALLRAVLIKQFSDRQILVDEALISFMLLRMPRSLEAARSLVARIDEQALEERAEVTRSFVSRILRDMTEPNLFDADDQNDPFTKPS